MHILLLLIIVTLSLIIFAAACYWYYRDRRGRERIAPLQEAARNRHVV